MANKFLIRRYEIRCFVIHTNLSCKIATETCNMSGYVKSEFTVLNTAEISTPGFDVK